MLRKGYRFVYSLLDKDRRVFYIGCSYDAYKRYTIHLCVRSTTRVSQYIACMLEKGEFPDLHIIEYLPEKEALAKETELIKAITLSGHSLENSALCIPKEIRYAPSSFKKRKNALLAARYQQNKCLFFFFHLEENGRYLTNYYPEIPKFKPE